MDLDIIIEINKVFPAIDVHVGNVNHAYVVRMNVLLVAQMMDLTIHLVLNNFGIMNVFQVRMEGMDSYFPLLFHDEVQDPLNIDIPKLQNSV